MAKRGASLPIANETTTNYTPADTRAPLLPCECLPENNIEIRINYKFIIALQNFNGTNCLTEFLVLEVARICYYGRGINKSEIEDLLIAPLLCFTPQLLTHPQSATFTI